MKRNLGPILLLLALALLVYAVNLDDYFLGDDFDLIHSFHDKPASYFFKLLYSTQAGDAFAHYGLDSEQGRGFIRPLSIWLLRIDFALWGIRPLGYHLTSVAMFAALVITVFLLLQMLLGSTLAAFVGGVAIAVHPAFAQSVPWIAGREEITVTWLAVAAFGFFVRHRLRSGSIAGYYVCYALAVLCKEPGVSVIALAVLYDLLCLRGRESLRRVVRTHAPAALILIGYLGLRLLAFGNVKGGYGTDTSYLSPAAFAGYHTAFFRELFGKTMLSIHQLPLVALVVGLALAGIVLVLVRNRARLPPGYLAQLAFFGPVWYFVSTFVFHGIEFSARHGALPVTGLTLFAVLLADGLLRVTGISWTPLATAALVAAVLIAFLPVTLSHAWTFDAASKAVRQLRSRIDADTVDLPPGSTVYIARVPQDELPPYYFGWSLLAALKRPFTESDLAARSRVFNPQNLWMNGIEVEMPQQFDRVLDYPWTRKRIGS